MALPEQAIEKLARSPEKTRGAYGELIMLSATLFLASVLIYFGLLLGYEPYLQKKVVDLDSQIATFNKKISETDQKDLIRFYSQVTNLQNLIQNHVVGSGFFSWLERNTQTNVYWSKLSLNAQTKQATLTGFARTVEDAAEQVRIFESQPEVSLASVNNIGVQGSLWQFNVNLAMTNDVFISSPQNP